MARMEEDVPDMTAPVFDLFPEACNVEEGETVKFKVKVSGNPRPKVTWWVNGNIAISVSSIFTKFDCFTSYLPKNTE